MKNDYYSGGYIAHGLMETKHAIKELFNCLDKAVEILNQ